MLFSYFSYLVAALVVQFGLGGIAVDKSERTPLKKWAPAEQLTWRAQVFGRGRKKWTENKEKTGRVEECWRNHVVELETHAHLIWVSRPEIY